MTASSIVACSSVFLRRSQLIKRAEAGSASARRDRHGGMSPHATTPRSRSELCRCRWVPRARRSQSPEGNTNAIGYIFKRSFHRHVGRCLGWLTPSLLIVRSALRRILAVVLPWLGNYNGLYFQDWLVSKVTEKVTRPYSNGCSKQYLNNCASCNRHVFIFSEGEA